MVKKVLLVEPSFPFPNRSKNRANSIHKNFAPIGLLKLGAYHKSKGDEVKLVRGNLEINEFNDFLPKEILVTSLFTYWSKYVWDSVEHYRNLFPKAIIKIGGIYVTLHKKNKDFIRKIKKYNVRAHFGVQENIENFLPDYSLIDGDVEHHITHAMRGCIRRCDFCGTWKIEPKLSYKTSNQLISEIKRVGKNKVIFFDNNFFANPHIKEILKDLSELKINGRSVTFESQSGFDGRLLDKDPELASLLKKARFSEIRIAWDHSVNDSKSLKKQITYLKKAGFNVKEIYVFMIYNFNIPYEEMLKKLKFCGRWKVQIADCRYRPLSATFDNYRPHIKDGQTNEDYYIHEEKNWTDKKVKDFRRKVRQHNMEVRYANGKKYNKDMEKWSAIHNTYKFFNLGRPPFLEKIKKDPVLKERIELLSKLKNHYKKENIFPQNIKKIPEKSLNKKLKIILNKNLK